MIEQMFMIDCVYATNIDYRIYCIYLKCKTYFHLVLVFAKVFVVWVFVDEVDGVVKVLEGRWETDEYGGGENITGVGCTSGGE